MPRRKRIDPSQISEEINGEVQAPQREVTLSRPDGNPVVVPENMVEDLQKKGFTIAEPGEFSEKRERNVQRSFETANADEIAKGVRIAQIVEDAINRDRKSRRAE